MLAQYTHAKQLAWNLQHEPLLGADSAHPSAVVPCSVHDEDAKRCAAFLNAQWKGGQLNLASGRAIFGWQTYGKTLSPHDAEQQRTNTLLLTHDLLPAVREHLPGFAQMESTLTQWLTMWTQRPVKLFYAHGLRQSPRTLQSTGFAIHQDTEDFDFISHTIVVKLTADRRDEAPSQMRVVGGSGPFSYAPAAGASGMFQARLYHASVAPVSKREHLKIAFFFYRA